MQNKKSIKKTAFTISILFLGLFIAIPYQSTVMGEKYGYECECYGYEINNYDEGMESKYCFGYTNSCQLEYGSPIAVGPMFSFKIRLFIFIILSLFTLLLYKNNPRK